MSARALAAAAALTLALATLGCAGPVNRQASSHNALRQDARNQSHTEQSVCVSDDVLYQAGDAMPAPTPCARCVCRPPRSDCAPVTCAQRPGCKALQRPNQCCPEYQCECERNGRVYANGERLSDADAADEGGDPCRACYCRGGEVVCAAVECYRRDDCEPQLVPGRCCPKYDHCPPLVMDEARYGARPHHTRATFQPGGDAEAEDQLLGASNVREESAAPPEAAIKIAVPAVPWSDVTATPPALSTEEGSGALTTTTSEEEETTTVTEEPFTRLFVLSKEAELDPTTVSSEYTDVPEEMSTTQQGTTESEEGRTDAPASIPPAAALADDKEEEQEEGRTDVPTSTPTEDKEKQGQEEGRIDVPASTSVASVSTDSSPELKDFDEWSSGSKSSASSELLRDSSSGASLSAASFGSSDESSSQALASDLHPAALDIASPSSSSSSSSEEKTPQSGEKGGEGDEGGPPILLIGDDLANHQMDIVVGSEEEAEGGRAAATEAVTLSTATEGAATTPQPEGESTATTQGAEENLTTEFITTGVTAGDEIGNTPTEESTEAIEEAKARIQTTEEVTEAPSEETSQDSSTEMATEVASTLLPTTDLMLGDQPHTDLSPLRVRLPQEEETSTEQVEGKNGQEIDTEKTQTTQEDQTTETQERTTIAENSHLTTQPPESQSTTQAPEAELTTQPPEYTSQTEAELLLKSFTEQRTEPATTEEQTTEGGREGVTEEEQATTVIRTEEPSPLSSEEISTPPPDTTSSDAAVPVDGTTLLPSDGDVKINPEVLGLKPTPPALHANATANATDPDAVTTLSPQWLKDAESATPAHSLESEGGDGAEASEAQRIERRVDETDKKDLFLLEDFFTKLYRHQIATDAAAAKER